MNITAHGLQCAAENKIEQYLLTVADAQACLFRLLRKEIPGDCRDMLDQLQDACRCLDWNRDEDSRYFAAERLKEAADKLADELNEGRFFDGL